MSSNSLYGQLLINEICPSNKSSISDQYGETPDWIELYNTTDQELNLTDVYISDNPSELLKFHIPQLTISANDFTIVFASDRDEINTEIHTSFKLSSDGEGVYLSSSTGELMDSISFPGLPIDFSYGRKIDGTDGWVTFATTSPGESNNEVPVFEELEIPNLTFGSGIYREEVIVSLENPSSDLQARYTTDGTLVTINSNPFSSLNITETTNLRIAFFNANGNKGKEKHAIYFYGINNDLPIINLSTEPRLLYDSEIGIFRKGPDADSEYPFYGANFWKDIEIPLHFSFFEENELKIEYSLGGKIHGGKASRTNPMQSIRLIADNEYGESEMSYPFFKETENTTYKRLVLRNASGDFNHTHFRDGYLARYCAKDKLDLDLLQFRPVNVYINGAYYGLLYIREKIDKHYIKTHYDLEVEEFDLLEKDTQIVEGNFDLFDEHLAFLLDNDMSIDSNFTRAKTYFDVDHYIDYVAVQSIVNNTDWPKNNIKYWREKEGGKWRYFLFDMDVSMGRYGWTKADRNYLGAWVDTLSNATYYRMLTKFWENKDYSDQFATRYSDLLNTTFRMENWMAETVRTKETLEPHIRKQFQEWPGNNDFAWWQEKGIPQMYEYIIEREDYAREFLRQRFDLTDPEKVSISVDPPAAGYIDLNTITINDLPWDGMYFGEIRSTLKAQNNPGFQFSHWEVIGEATTNKIANELWLDDFGDVEVIAHYTGEFIGPAANIYPNPSNGSFTIDFTNNKRASVELNFFNTVGALVYSINTNPLPAGPTSYLVETSPFNEGIYFLELNLGEYTQTKKIIISR